MDDIERLRAEVNSMRKAMVNIRADLTAYRIVLNASFIAMSAQTRRGLRTQVEEMGERVIADGLARSSTPDDMIHALQAAFARVHRMLDGRPLG